MSIEQILNHEMQLSNYQLQSLKMLSYKQEEIIQYLYRVEDNYPYIQYNFNDSKNTVSMDKYKSYENDIRQDLIDQLFDCNLTNKCFNIAKFIILNLDNKGFFDIDKKSFCNQKNISLVEFQSIKEIIQNLLPIGCGSENTFDFISFQLQKKGYGITCYSNYFEIILKILLMKNLISLVIMMFHMNHL